MSTLADLSGLDLEFLGIAEGRVYKRPVKVHTLLGSCVAVTMHCRAGGMGGMFHGLLPTGEAKKQGDDVTPYRFVNTGVGALCAAMNGQGAEMPGLEAKVFGGAGTLGRDKGGVGLKNVRAALVALERLGIRVAAVNVGGRNGRKVYFLPHTGEVYIKALPVSASQFPPDCRLNIA